MVDAELDKVGVQQEVRDMADFQRRYRGRIAATTDRRVISKARVIDGAAVMKVKEEKARQAEEEAHQAAVRAEAKEQWAAARVEAARVKAARAVATKAKGGI
jgi:hypothetical protein